MGSQGMQRQIRVWRARVSPTVQAYLQEALRIRKAICDANEAEAAKDPRFAGLTGIWYPDRWYLRDILGECSATGAVGTFGGRARG